MAEKTITLRIDEELHRDIKVVIAQKGMTLKDYIVTLVKTDMSQSHE